MSAEHSIPLFPTEEIPRILDTILFHAGTLRKKEELERENSLTNRLVKLLRKDKLFRSAPYTIIWEHPVFDDSNKEGQSGQIDINFICPPGDETYFAIEAKRLHVAFPSGRKSLVGEYVAGDQGMMCFITGKYSRFQQSAAMLGYVFDGNVVEAGNAIAKSVCKHACRIKLEPPHRMQNSSILPGKNVTETRHGLESRIFTVYHLLVSVA